ncbi:MAG: electron transfer flavoprotein subunit beta/FixA family protein [Dehalococcoidia bacterium]
MHFVVCAKQIPDPETPPSAFKIDESTNTVVPAQGFQPVLSQYDGIAAEAALQIKEALGDEAKITVLSVGAESAQAAIKQVLAMGADEGVLLQDDAFEGGDSHTTAKVLAAAISNLGDVDAIFCGRQAADWDVGQVGLLVAEALGWPAAILAKGVEISDGSMKTTRVMADGFETVSQALPAVVTVSNEFGEPRYPKLQQIMQAAKKTVTTMTHDQLGLDPSEVGSSGARLKLEKLYIPQSDSQVEIIDGETPEEQATNLIAKLVADKVL